MNITDYTALELGKKIKSGDITVVEATRAFLDEIKAKDGVVTRISQLRNRKLWRGLKKFRK